MRKVSAVVVLVLVCVAVGLSSFSARAQSFGWSALSGRYSIVLSGSDTTNSTPVSLTGVLDFNGAGGVTHHGVISYDDGGTFCSFSNILTGSYAVANDGSGTLDIMLDPASTTCANPPMVTMSLVLALFKNGKQANVSTVATTLNNAVLSGTMSLQKNFP